jgi:sugar lactone lactonase YvrE
MIKQISKFGGYTLKMLQIKLRNKALYIIVIDALIIFLIFLAIYLGNMINYENKSEIGKAELFVKGMRSPQGMVLDNDGRLFVQSGYDGKISIISKDGVANDYIYIDDYYGYGIDMDYAGNFIIAAKQQVVVIDNNGDVLRVISGFKNAYDVAMGPNSSIYVSDSDDNVIYRISPTNEVTLFAELNVRKSNTIRNAAGICFDKDYKNLYVVSMYRGELYKISLSKEYKAESIEVAASNLKRPNFIDTDEEGNVFITCIGDNTIVRVNQNSIKELIDTKGKLSNPTEIVVNNINEKILYVGSKENNSIYKITMEANN